MSVPLSLYCIIKMMDSLRAEWSSNPPIIPLMAYLWDQNVMHYCKKNIDHFEKYHNTLCLSPQILHEHCLQFLLGLKMVPRENKNNANAKFEGTNKEYYGIVKNGALKVYSICWIPTHHCLPCSEPFKEPVRKPAEGTAIYGLYRYVPLWRVWFSSSLL